MKEYEIWIEGYRATGESSDASFIGKSKGETFIEACENFVYPEDTKSWDGKKIAEWAGKHLELDKDPDGNLRYGKPSIWACSLFDNEADARKSFG